MRLLFWLSTIPLRLRSLLRRSRPEAKLDEEIQDHLERHIGMEMARGLSYEEARLSALRAFGGIEQRKEELQRPRWPPAASPRGFPRSARPGSIRSPPYVMSDPRHHE